MKSTRLAVIGVPSSAGGRRTGQEMGPPALRSEANPFDEETDESWAENVRNDIHTQPFNFSGSPTLSVPCGFSTDGLPLSVQFVGRRLSESVVCRVGHAYEQATQWHSKHPAV